MSRTLPIAILMALASLTVGCRMVQLDPNAEAVRVLETEMAGCTEVATTRVKVLEKVGFFARNEQKMSDELDTLARNAAAEKGGNAVAADGPIEAGARRYRVLRCPSP